MHPAKSVIFFTTASGAGYGMLAWLAVFAWADLLPADRLFGLVAFGLAFVLVVGGLLSSTFHLGHPERAWRAMSQWKSSWLSREGLAAVLTFIPTGLFAASWVFLEDHGGLAGYLGLLGALMSLVTVYFTSMIYASLKAIPAWSNRWTPPAYLILSLATGALLVAVMAGMFALSGLAVLLKVAFVALVFGLVIKLIYWASRNSAAPVSTSGTATGLEPFGKVGLIEAPHTESNYLLEEMGFKVARKHASKLRQIAISLGFVVPLAVLAMMIWLPVQGHVFWLVASTLSCSAGLIAERWLFFAEAKHVVTLYYGNEGV